MAPRPAKRQRRATIILSDDDDSPSSTPNPPKKVQDKPIGQREITLAGGSSLGLSPIKPSAARATSKRSPSKASPKSSPEKSRKILKTKKEPERSKSIQAFFGKATDEDRWRKKSATPDIDFGDGELGDAIEDDDLSDNTLRELGIKTDKAGLAEPPLARNGSGSVINVTSVSAPSRRFVKTEPSNANSVKIKQEDSDAEAFEDQRPWADRYGPTTLEELVVHKKKVADVQSWLEGKLNGRNHQKLLVLKGPAGSGKTTTLSLVVQKSRLHLVSWHNPTTSEAGANSVSKQFEEFLGRGGQFDSLSFENRAVQRDNASGDAASRVLLVEEFPTSTSAVQSFRSAILQFLARGSSLIGFRSQAGMGGPSPPVVLIISETLISSSTARSDSFTAHQLLGPEILNHPLVTTMEFNPVAPTFVNKALDLIIKKEARDSGRRRIPGPAVIQRLAEMGDVRSAVNSLEFLCLRGGNDTQWSGTVAAKPKKSTKDTTQLTEMEKNSLRLVAQRETTLDMFHAAGKIVYNKREDPRVVDSRASPPPKPPDHLMHLYSPKASLVDIEALLAETGTDIQTFISTVHENYVLSCNGDNFEPSFEGCADMLSASDILNPEARPSRRGRANPNASIVSANLQAGASDTLRQDEISFNVATRGVLFCLPYPVSRAAPPGGRKGDTFKMFYPAALRLWKVSDEMESILDLLVHSADLTSVGYGKTASAAENESVLNWRSRDFGGTIAEPNEATGLDEDFNDTTLLSRRSKHSLATEILPYAAQILHSRHRDIGVMSKITTFQAHSAFSLSPDAEMEEDELEGDQETGVKTSNGLGGAATSPFKIASAGAKPSKSPQKGQAHDGNHPKMEKLYISDDDIVDE